MFVIITRWLPRVACALALVACADGTNPAAPDATQHNLPQLSTAAPTAEELALMPAGFSVNPSLQRWFTAVGFFDGVAYGQALMHYWATNAEQRLKLDVQYDHRTIASKEGFTDDSTILPWEASMWTQTAVPVSGSCGHLVGGTGIHTVWHKFLITGWRLFEWGRHTESSYDVAAQPMCPPPPPTSPGYGGGPDEYEGTCEMCQEWLYYVDGHVVDVWWECEEIDASYCESGSLR